jgi:predicted ABC-type ATPase
MPDLYIIAGPNGAGKTTLAYTLLPDFLRISEFVNADEIARGLSPFNVDGVKIQAGKLMLQRIDDLLTRKKSFAFETTLASTNYVKLIQRAKLAGYKTHLIFLYLPSATIAKKRVKQRVTMGGHHIPARDIERRFKRGIVNLIDIFLPLVNSAAVYNSHVIPPSIIATASNGFLNIEEKTQWKKMLNQKK